MSSSRSLEEVTELESALCLLIQRASDIAVVKAALSEEEEKKVSEKLKKMCDDSFTASTSTVVPAKADQGSAERPMDTAEGDGAMHAEPSNSKLDAAPTEEEKPTVSALSQLITPGIERQLPTAARRVSPGSDSTRSQNLVMSHATMLNSTAPQTAQTNFAKL